MKFDCISINNIINLPSKMFLKEVTLGEYMLFEDD